MACTQCGGTHSSYLPANFCPTNNKDCGSMDASCVKYTGAALTCIDKPSNVSVEEIILAIDAKVCETAGGWDSYNYHCLSDDVVITTAAQFVDKISGDFCTLRDSYDTFTTTTYPTAVTNLQNQITSILQPNLTLCAFTGVGPSDTYTSILTKFSDKICQLGSVDISTANWNQCFTLSSTPTTEIEAFNAVIDQICILKNNPVTPTLPTFDNTGSCLAAPVTSSDSLTSTVNKIKSRLCLSPTFDIDGIDWVGDYNCLDNPAPGTGPNLQDAFNYLTTVVKDMANNIPTFDAGIFEVTQAASCGKVVTITGGVTSTDRLVASDASDLTPGTLADKLVAGTGVSISNLTTPGKITISSVSTDNKVAATSTDPNPASFLSDKINGGLDTNNSGVSTEKFIPAGGAEVQIVPKVDAFTLMNFLMDAVEASPDLYARWCALNCGCAPCSTTPDPDTTPRRVKLVVVNTKTVDSAAQDVVFSQNTPTVSWLNTKITELPLATFDSGYYTITSSSTNPSITLRLLNNTGSSQIADIKVKRAIDNTVVSDASAFTGALTGSVFLSGNFLLGTSTGDLIVEVTIS